MASKNNRDQKPTSATKPAKPRGGEVRDRDLDQVTGGATAPGLPTGRRLTSADPCEGGR